jgi:hypothetical protein
MSNHPFLMEEKCDLTINLMDNFLMGKKLILIEKKSKFDEKEFDGEKTQI